LETSEPILTVHVARSRPSILKLSDHAPTLESPRSLCTKPRDSRHINNPTVSHPNGHIRHLSLIRTQGRSPPSTFGPTYTTIPFHSPRPRIHLSEAKRGGQISKSPSSSQEP